MTDEEALVECREGVEVLVSSLTELLDDRLGGLGGFTALPQPTAGYVIAAALAVLCALADEGHRELIEEMVRTIALDTQIAVLKAEA